MLRADCSPSVPANAPPPAASKTGISNSTVQKRRKVGKPFSSSFSFPCKSSVLSSVICFCLHLWFNKMPDFAVGTLQNCRQHCKRVPFCKRSFFIPFLKKICFTGERTGIEVDMQQEPGRFLLCSVRTNTPTCHSLKIRCLHTALERLCWKPSCSLPCCHLTRTWRKAF